MPAMSTLVYSGGLYRVLGGGIAGGRDLDSDAFKCTLHTSSYTPLVSHSYQSDLTNELGTAGGYTAGGATLAGMAISSTIANSWAITAAITTAYTLGQVVKPSGGNTYLYRCVVAGTSAGAPPTWPTVVGTTVTDGGVTWLNIGTAALMWTCTAPTWAAFTAGPFRTAVIADTTPGSAATNPLIAAMTFAADQTGGGGAFTITLDAGSGLFVAGLS
jgi:hypothetical protein